MNNYRKLTAEESRDKKLLINKKIIIDNMEGEDGYDGRVGVVRYIDDMGQLHGSWGGLAVNLDYDKIRVQD